MNTQKNTDLEIQALLMKMKSAGLSESESIRLEAHICSTYRDEQLNTFMENHWEELGKSDCSTAEIELGLQQIKTRIKAIISTQNTPSILPKRQLIYWSSRLMRVAAVLFIPLFLVSAYMFYLIHTQADLFCNQTAIQEVLAIPGTRVHFTLPDQTKVWLNSGSKLEYPIHINSQNKRKVKLTGQGYFEVAPDKKHPFFVETSGFCIKVLGTSFDVSCYENDPLMSSTLEEGTIALLDKKGNEMGRLHPGQQATLDRDQHKILIKEVDTELLTSWKDGRLIFRNSSLQELSQKLERWFNCTIQIDSLLMKSEIRYNATIQDETLGEVLNMIRISAPATITIKNREVNIEPKK